MVDYSLAKTPGGLKITLGSGSWADYSKAEQDRIVADALIRLMEAEIDG